MQNKIAVIGGGRWGTTIANILAEKSYEVSLWVHNKELAEILKTRYENVIYLPGIRINKNIIVTTELDVCIAKCEIIFLAIPSKYLRAIARKLSACIKKRTIIINLAKGIDGITHKPLSEILNEELTGCIIAVLSGPNHGIEIARKKHSATVIASKNKECLYLIERLLTTDYFKMYKSSDVVGVEICGAVKNIPAITCGILTELGHGDNAKAEIIIIGLNEMKILSRFFGAKISTVYGLAGLGDLVATCNSPHSRNVYVGRELAKGRTTKDIISSLQGRIAEGISTTKIFYEITKKNNLTTPLITEMFNILYKKKDIESAITKLLS